MTRVSWVLPVNSRRDRGPPCTTAVAPARSPPLLGSLRKEDWPAARGNDEPGHVDLARVLTVTQGEALGVEEDSAGERGRARSPCHDKLRGSITIFTRDANSLSTQPRCAAVVIVQAYITGINRRL